MSLSIVYVTVSTQQESEKIAKTLVDERLVACATVQSPMISFYRWENKIQKEQEFSLFLKTRSDLVDAVMIRVKELHSYDCPCILVLPIEKAFEPYAQWIKLETRKT